MKKRVPTKCGLAGGRGLIALYFAQALHEEMLANKL